VVRALRFYQAVPFLQVASQMHLKRRPCPIQSSSPFPLNKPWQCDDSYAEDAASQAASQVASQAASEFGLCPVAQESTAQVDAAAAVPQLWVHSPGQRRHVHDTEWRQSCAAAAACHAGLWSVSQIAGYAFLTQALVPCFNHSFVLALTHPFIIRSCMHVCIYLYIHLLLESFQERLPHAFGTYNLV